jgi:hypothetical protein
MGSVVLGLRDEAKEKEREKKRTVVSETVAS